MSNTGNQNPSTFLYYENPIYEIKMKYPANWQKTEQGPDTTTSTESKKVIATFAPDLNRRSPKLFLQVEPLIP